MKNANDKRKLRSIPRIPQERKKKMAYFVNGKQTKEERRTKYHLARIFKYTVRESSRMRDWKTNTLIKFIYHDKINKGEKK